MRFLSNLELQKSSVFFHSRNKLTLKDIHNCQYVTCMNPTAGSFTISPRLQRHFATYSVMIPSEESLARIYQAILSGHLLNSLNKFSQSVQDLCSNFVQATVQLHSVRLLVAKATLEIACMP